MPSILVVLLGLALVVIACLAIRVCKKRTPRTSFSFEPSPVTYSNPTYDEASRGADPLRNLIYMKKLASGIPSPRVVALDNPTYMERVPVDSNWGNTQLHSADNTDARRMSVRQQESDWGNMATQEPPHYSTLQH